MRLRQLFITFFRIGLFTIGGGYAMLPLIEREIVTKMKWMSKDEFSDGLTAAQSAPGPIAVNISIFVGYRLKGYRGAILSVIGSVLPSFVIILIIAMTLGKVADNRYLIGAFRALKPTVTALIGVTIFNVYQNSKMKISALLVTLLCALMMIITFLHPIYLILLAILTAFWENQYNAIRKHN